MDVSDDTVYKAYLTAYRGSYVPPLSAKHLAAAAIADKDREEKREPRTGAQVVAWVAALFDVGGAPTSGQTDAATDASNLAGLRADLARLTAVTEANKAKSVTVINPPGERKTPNPLLGKRHAFTEADAARRARDGHSVPEVRPGDILRLKPHLGRGEVMVVCDTIAGRAVRVATAIGAPQLVGMMTTEVVYGAYDIVWALDTPVSFQFAHGWWLATTKGCADPVRVALDIEEAVAAADAARKEGDCRSLRTLLDIAEALVALALRNDKAADTTPSVPSTPAAPNGVRSVGRLEVELDSSRGGDAWAPTGWQVVASVVHAAHEEHARHPHPDRPRIKVDAVGLGAAVVDYLMANHRHEIDVVAVVRGEASPRAKG